MENKIVYRIIEIDNKKVTLAPDISTNIWYIEMPKELLYDAMKNLEDTYKNVIFIFE